MVPQDGMTFTFPSQKESDSLTGALTMTLASGKFIQEQLFHLHCNFSG